MCECWVNLPIFSSVLTLNRNSQIQSLSCSAPPEGNLQNHTSISGGGEGECLNGCKNFQPTCMFSASPCTPIFSNTGYLPLLSLSGVWTAVWTGLLFIFSVSTPSLFRLRFVFSSLLTWLPPVYHWASSKTCSVLSVAVVSSPVLCPWGFIPLK